MKSKTVALLIIIVLLAVNSGLLFSYYSFYLSDRMITDLTDAKNQNYNSLYAIAKTIDGKNLDDSIKVIKSYTKENGGYVTLKDSKKNVIYTNKKTINVEPTSGIDF